MTQTKSSPFCILVGYKEMPFCTAGITGITRSSRPETTTSCSRTTTTATSCSSRESPTSSQMALNLLGAVLRRTRRSPLRLVQNQTTLSVNSLVRVIANSYCMDLRIATSIDCSSYQILWPVLSVPQHIGHPQPTLGGSCTGFRSRSASF